MSLTAFNVTFSIFVRLRAANNTSTKKQKIERQFGLSFWKNFDRIECVRWFAVGSRQRPYFVEHTRSHPNSEVKLRKARSVLGWGTAREVLRVLLAFLNFDLFFFGGIERVTEARQLVFANGHTS